MQDARRGHGGLEVSGICPGRMSLGTPKRGSADAVAQLEAPYHSTAAASFR